MSGGFGVSGPWSIGHEPGALQSWAFAGTEGLLRLSGPSVFTSEAGDFAAALTRIQLDHVAVESFSGSSHRAERGSMQIEAFPTRLLTILFVVSGRAAVSLASSSFELHAGECIVVDSEDLFTYETADAVRLLRAVVGAGHVPKQLWHSGATIPHALQRTPLVESFLAFIAELLHVGGRARGASSDQLIRSVAHLFSAVLAEAQRLLPHPGGPAGLRYRIEDFIERHYRDPRVDATRVAQALGISAGHAHAVFKPTGRTIAQSIKTRRVSSVSEALRTQPVLPSYPVLATEHGFGSLDALRRAFRQEHGMTLSAYRTSSHHAIG